MMKYPSLPPRDGAFLAFGMVGGICLTMLFHLLLGVY